MIRTRQRGVALLTVLLLVAVMTVLVIGVLDDIRFGVRRAGNAQTVAQAQRYALGAEALARSQMQRLARRDPGRTALDGNWNDRPFALPIGSAATGAGDPGADGTTERDPLGSAAAAGGEAGIISVRVFDSTTCFNLNSVVQGAGEQWQRSDIGAGQFTALVAALGIPGPRGDALADALVDWIDADQAAGPQGAEDAAYAGRGYLTAGALLAEVSELRAVRGFDDAVYARLRNHVCALPTPDLSPINVNTLERDDGALLSMLTRGALSPEDGRRVILARPPGGWRDYASFWAHPALAALSLPNPVLEQVALRTRYFGLHAEVEYGGAHVVLSALFEQDAAGDTRLLARRWSADE